MFDTLRTWASRAWQTIHRRRADRDFQDELDSHTGFLIAENLRLGLAPEEARRAALLRLGNAAQLREEHADVAGLPVLERVAQDLRYAVRVIRKSPGFTLFAGAALALGIAGTTAVFSIADAVLLRPFPYRNPSRLVMVWEDDSAYGFPQNNGSPFAFQEWRERNHVFQDMAALTHDSLNLTGDGNPEYLHADTVTPNFFSVLGVNAIAGRTFNTDDGRPGAPLTAVLSYALWARRFGADAGIVGHDVLMNGAKYTVVGVMPRNFQFLDPKIDVWVPSQWTPEFIQRRMNDHFLTIVARLNDGITLTKANAELQVLSKQLSDEHIWDTPPVIVPLREQVAGNVRPSLLVLLGAVAFVLLIACANVANLLLARGSARRREMALRLALGAARKRIVEQMLTESLLLSCVAGSVGLLLAVWGTRFLILLIPKGIASTAQIDFRILAFTAAVSIATGVLFGVLPALRASNTSLVTPLKQGGGQSGVGVGGQRLRHVLVVSEVSLAMVLLAGAALMIRSFEKLSTQDPGFRAEHVLTLQTALPRPKYADFARRSEFYGEVVQRVESLPGVVAAGYATYIPLANSGGGSLVTVENRPFDPKHMLIANVRVVTPDYFRTIGMTLRQGRLLDRSDGPDAPKVVVVNESMARQYWPGQNPLGHRFKRGLLDSKSPWFTVVGVVADMRQGGMDVPVRPEGYFPYQQVDFFAPDSLVVRTVGDPLNVTEDVRRQIWAVDKDQPVSSVMPLTELVDQSVAQPRLNTLLLGGFAFMGLLLAALGIYAVLSFAVAQRTQEIGVRVALGARPRDVLRMVIANGIRLFLAGLAIGLTAAFALSRLLAHLLFEVGPNDPLSYAVVMVVLAAVTLLACYLPARRAMRVDPMVALRYE